MSYRIGETLPKDPCFFSPLYCVLPIDAPNLSALLGKAVLTEKKAREILTGD
jgi:hypothetical protein